MLLALPWIARRDRAGCPGRRMMGLAVFAKGPVPLVLAAPLVLGGAVSRPARGRVIVPLRDRGTAVVRALLSAQRGDVSERFFSGYTISSDSPRRSLQHAQPWWYFIPVLALLLLPWTALAPLAAIGAKPLDQRRLYLLLWTLWPLVFFSISVNKLPGYILPLLPALAALIALGLNEMRNTAPWLAFTALLLVAYPIAAPLLAVAIGSGLSRAPHPQFQPVWLAPLALAALVWFLDARGRRLAAIACLVVAATVGMVYLKLEMGRTPFARSLWNSISARAPDVCVASLDRSWRYGLHYYSTVPLPDCSQNPKPLQVIQRPGGLPELVKAVDPH